MLDALGLDTLDELIQETIPDDIRLTVITNSIQVLLVAGNIKNRNINLVSLGGLLNIKNYSVSKY